MSRRRPRAEIQFGSDSFLDVVANIVGILIILIVIAGLRVSRTPVVKTLAVHSGALEHETIPIPGSSLPPMDEAIEGKTKASHIVVLEPVDESPAEQPPLPPLVAPQELVDVVSQIESDLSEIQKEETQLQETHHEAKEMLSALVERQKILKSELAQKSDEVAVAKENAAKAAEKTAADLVLARKTLERLSKQVQELEEAPAHVETLQHKITPISRVVNGGERHYRLEHNRVAEVPLDEMIESFRDQIERRKDWLVKTRQHQGRIGPIKGFNMKYFVRVEPSSDLDRMRGVPGGYRISLENWEIEPEPDLKGETEEVALRKGSQFYQSILSATADTTLTFWVYPDSYQLYRRLQKFTHQHGFSVAGRPLPKGVPIAGSPNGSKSASQ